MAKAATRSRRHDANCRNCSTALAGRHCHVCGQDSRPPPQRLAPLLGLFLSHASGFESKALRTIAALLFRPGRLTQAYIVGERIRYSNPVQVYLWCTALFFLLHAYLPLIQLDIDSGAVSSSLSAVSIYTEISASTLERVRQSNTLVEFAARFDIVATTTLPVLLAVLVAASALLLATLFWQEPALTQVVFALHWSSFYFALETVRQILLHQLGSWGGPLSALGSLVILTYLVIAMRVVYRRSWIGSVLRGIFAVIVFAALLGGWLWTTAELAEWLA